MTLLGANANYLTASSNSYAIIENLTSAERRPNGGVGLKSEPANAIDTIASTNALLLSAEIYHA